MLYSMGPTGVFRSFSTAWVCRQGWNITLSQDGAVTASCLGSLVPQEKQTLMFNLSCA